MNSPGGYLLPQGPGGLINISVHVNVLGGGGGSVATPVMGTVPDSTVDDGTSPVKVGAVYTPVAQAYASGAIVRLHADSAGNLLISLNTALDSSNDSVCPGAGRGRGASSFALPASSGTINSTLVTAQSGGSTMWDFEALNFGASTRFLKLYDQIVAPSPLSGHVPIRTIPIPATVNGALGGVVRSYPVGVKFLSGIAFCLTANPLAADNTVIASGDITFNMGYAG